MSLHSLGHSRRGGCNGYDTIQLLQPQSVFSIFVYLYLQTDFSPFTTTPVHIPLLLHNRKRSSVLVGSKVLGFLQAGPVPGQGLPVVRDLDQKLGTKFQSYSIWTMMRCVI